MITHDSNPKIANHSVVPRRPEVGAALVGALRQREKGNLVNNHVGRVTRLD